MALLAMLCIGYATVSFGAPAHNIKYTKHNFGTAQKYGAFVALPGAEGSTEICIFCHTPHNSVPGQKFLWNRIAGEVTQFQMYTSSPTLNFTSKPTMPGELSKMCMTCHDGVSAINAMANPRGIVGMNYYYNQIGDIYDGDPDFSACEDPLNNPWCKNIGEGELTFPGDQFDDSYTAGTGGALLNDHPISFIYSQSEADSTIKTADGANGSSIGGLPLWYSTIGPSSGYRVECVTCHDPHINYMDGTPGGNSAYKPFLRKTMNSSSLCFTCHNK